LVSLVFQGSYPLVSSASLLGRASLTFCVSSFGFLFMFLLSLWKLALPYPLLLRLFKNPTRESCPSIFLTRPYIVCALTPRASNLCRSFGFPFCRWFVLRFFRTCRGRRLPLYFLALFAIVIAPVCSMVFLLPPLVVFLVPTPVYSPSCLVFAAACSR